MGAHRSFIASLSALALTIFLAGPAIADFEAAQSAVDQGKFEEARKELESLRPGNDPRVFRLLGELMSKGLGGPADPAQAYVLFSLATMTAQDSDEFSAAWRGRRGIAQSLDARQIVLAEAAVVQWVDQKLGQGEREKRIKSLQKSLDGCQRECDSIAYQVFEFGPAAASLIPALEKLMTRDPMWMPRNVYVRALAAIGTAAVPALTRIMLDEAQMATEGFYNMQLAMQALGILGPVAGEARKSLLEALGKSYSGLGGEEEELFNDLAGESRTDLVEMLKLGLIAAMVSIGDPGREIHNGLLDYMDGETNMRLKLATAGAIGLLYHEPGAGLDLAEQVLNQDDPRTLMLAVGLVADFYAMPEQKNRIERLIPRIKELASEQQKNSELRESSRSSLDVFVADDLASAVELMRKKDYAEAELLCRTINAKDPWSVQGRTISGEAKRELGNIDGAIEDYSAAMEADDPPYWLQFALEDAGMETVDLADVHSGKAKALVAKCVRDAKCYAALKNF